MKKFYIVSILSIILFTGCINEPNPPKSSKESTKVQKSKKCECSLDEIKDQLSKDEKRVLYKNIKNDINHLIDEADTYYEKTYFFKALQTYELINFYHDKELIPKSTLNKLQTRMTANGKYYYEKALNTDDDILKKLFYLNELMRNDPEYKDGKVLYNTLRKDKKIVELLQKDKQRLAVLLLNKTSNEEKYLTKLDETIDHIASYDDLDPLVLEAKEILANKRYLLRDMGIELFEKKQLDEAKQKFEFIEQLYKKDKTSLEYLSKIGRYEELKDMESEAITALQSNDYKKAMNIANDILSYNDNNSQALNIIKKANIELKRQIPKMIKKATLYYNNQNYTKALEMFQEVLNLDSVNNTALTYTKKIKAQLKTIQSLK